MCEIYHQLVSGCWVFPYEKLLLYLVSGSGVNVEDEIEEMERWRCQGVILDSLVIRC